MQERLQNMQSRFEMKEVKIDDPNNKGESFSLYLDEQGQPSLLEMERFNLGWLNVAEGYTGNDILKVAEDILQGRQELHKTRILHRVKVCFNTSRGVVCSRASSHRVQAFSNYSMKT